jgi:hypothetical protein
MVLGPGQRQWEVLPRLVRTGPGGFRRGGRPVAAGLHSWRAVRRDVWVGEVQVLGCGRPTRSGPDEVRRHGAEQAQCLLSSRWGQVAGRAPSTDKPTLAVTPARAALL